MRFPWNFSLLADDFTFARVDRNQNNSRHGRKFFSMDHCTDSPYHPYAHTHSATGRHLHTRCFFTTREKISSDTGEIFATIRIQFDRCTGEMRRSRTGRCFTRSWRVERGHSRLICWGKTSGKSATETRGTRPTRLNDFLGMNTSRDDRFVFLFFAIGIGVNTNTGEVNKSSVGSRPG